MTLRTRILIGLSVAAVAAAALTVIFAIDFYVSIRQDNLRLERSNFIRGAVQRLAKNDFGAGRPAETIAQVDRALDEFERAMAGDRIYAEAKDSLRAFDTQWQAFKALLLARRVLPESERRDEMLAMSEALWHRSDEVIGFIQANSERLLANARYLLVSLGALLSLSIVVALMARSHVAGRLEAASITDHLTGLYNRRQFDALLEQEVRRAERSGQCFALICFDLDHFKLINDRLGHAAGDRALISVARAVRPALRRSDMLFRIGGDEFAAILPATEGPEGLRVAEKARSTVTSLPPLRGQEGLEICAGVAAWFPGVDPKALLEAADGALYLAKQGGRGRSILAPSLRE